MQTTKLHLKSANGGFTVDVLAGTEFEEEVLTLLDKYADRIEESAFF